MLTNGQKVAQSGKIGRQMKIGLSANRIGTAILIRGRWFQAISIDGPVMW